MNLLNPLHLCPCGEAGKQLYCMSAWPIQYRWRNLNFVFFTRNPRFSSWIQSLFYKAQKMQRYFILRYQRCGWMINLFFILYLSALASWWGEKGWLKRDVALIGHRHILSSWDLITSSPNCDIAKEGYIHFLHFQI